MDVLFASLNPVFESYERLRAEADALFERIRLEHADCVSCAPGCSDCCHAVFDLSLVEALYVNRAFKSAFAFGPERSAVIAAADDADRKAARIKRALYNASKEHGARHVLEDAARARVRCPLLDAEERCRLYEQRPVTCRLYGIPTVIGGESHVCGKTNFIKGRPYPTVDLAKIQDRLAAMSREITRLLGSRLKELHLVYVPLSMALLANYDAAYLGAGPAEDKP